MKYICRDCGKPTDNRQVLCNSEIHTKAEIERLEKEITEYKLRMKMLSNTVNEIKSEAIKEFAEQLKKRFYLLDGRCVVDIPQINNLVKEMTEGESDE